MEIELLRGELERVRVQEAAKVNIAEKGLSLADEYLQTQNSRQLMIQQLTKSFQDTSIPKHPSVKCQEECRTWKVICDELSAEVTRLRKMANPITTTGDASQRLPQIIQVGQPPMKVGRLPQFGVPQERAFVAEEVGYEPANLSADAISRAAERLQNSSMANAQIRAFSSGFDEGRKLAPIREVKAGMSPSNIPVSSVWSQQSQPMTNVVSQPRTNSATFTVPAAKHTSFDSMKHQTFNQNMPQLQSTGIVGSNRYVGAYRTDSPVKVESQKAVNVVSGTKAVELAHNPPSRSMQDYCAVHVSPVYRTMPTQVPQVKTYSNISTLPNSGNVTAVTAVSPAVSPSLIGQNTSYKVGGGTYSVGTPIYASNNTQYSNFNQNCVRPTMGIY